MAKKTAFKQWLITRPDRNQISPIYFSMKNNILKSAEMETLFASNEDIEKSLATLIYISEFMVEKEALKKTIFSVRKNKDTSCEGFPSVEDYGKDLICKLENSVNISNTFTPISDLVNAEFQDSTFITSETEFNRIKHIIKYYLALFYLTSKPQDATDTREEIISRLPKFITKQYKKSFYKSVLIILCFVTLCVLAFPQKTTMIFPFLMFAVFMLYTIIGESKRRYRRIHHTTGFISTLTAEIAEFKKYDRFKSIVSRSVVRKDCWLIELKINLLGCDFQLPAWSFDQELTEEFLENKLNKKSTIELISYDNALFLGTIQ